MEKKIGEPNEELVKRLNVLIALNVRKELKEDKTLRARDMIEFLSASGMKYTDIAIIFGKSSSYIASELTQIKKASKKKAESKNIALTEVNNNGP